MKKELVYSMLRLSFTPVELPELFKFIFLEPRETSYEVLKMMLSAPLQSE